MMKRRGCKVIPAALASGCSFISQDMMRPLFQSSQSNRADGRLPDGQPGSFIGVYCSAPKPTGTLPLLACHVALLRES